VSEWVGEEAKREREREREEVTFVLSRGYAYV
jgi:hypothetical protein